MPTIVAFLLLVAVVASGRLQAQVLTPVSKEFLLAAETVVDDADAVDETASNSIYSSQMQEARSAYGALGRLATTDVERQIVAESGQLLFVTDTCHIEAQNLSSHFSQCLADGMSHRTTIMVLLSRHKIKGSWLDGPPV